MARASEPAAQPRPEPDPFDWAGPARGVHRPGDARPEADVLPPQGAAGVSAEPAPGDATPDPPQPPPGA